MGKFGEIVYTAVNNHPIPIFFVIMQSDLRGIVARSLLNMRPGIGREYLLQIPLISYKAIQFISCSSRFLLFRAMLKAMKK